MEGSQTSQSTSQYHVCDAVQRLTHEIISINVKSFQKAFLFCFHFKNKYWALTIFEKNKDKLNMLIMTSNIYPACKFKSYCGFFKPM